MFARLAIVAAAAIFVWTGLTGAADSHGPKQVYVVRQHDTLWDIAAARYAGDVREAIYRIQRANDLDGGVLRPGQRLILP
jgi:nucleoid-associated protein YgaU